MNEQRLIDVLSAILSKKYGCEIKVTIKKVDDGSHPQEDKITQNFIEQIIA